MSIFNSKQLKIAKRYAAALCELDNRDVILAELQEVASVFSQSSDLKSFLISPVITTDDKKNVIEEVFASLSQSTKNFLFLLADKNRIDFFDSILEQFRVELDELNNVKRIEVYSAVELTEEEKTKIKEKLQIKLSCEIVPDYKIEENIMAGLVIKIKDKVIDLSLQTKFEDMKRQLIK